MSVVFGRRVGETWPFRSDLAHVSQRRQFCRPLTKLPHPLPKTQQALDILLAQSAAIGDRYNVIKLCDEGANIAINYTNKELTGPLRDSTWAHGMDTPLNRACAKGSLRTVEVMVEMLGAKVNVTGMRSGFSALHAAAQGGNCNVVRYLIKQGAKVNAAIMSGTGKTASTQDAPEMCLGYTPLMLAVMAKDPWSVNELLLAGARNNAQGLDGKTPQELLQALSATTAWDPIMAALSSLLEMGAEGVPRPVGSSTGAAGTGSAVKALTDEPR
jgi:hypothetical protein